MLSVTMIYVDGNFCHLVLLRAYIFVFCLVSRIPSISTLSTCKTVMTIIYWLQAVRLLLRFTVTLLPRSLDDVSFLYDLISFWWLLCLRFLSLSFSPSVSVSLSFVFFSLSALVADKAL